MAFDSTSDNPNNTINRGIRRIEISHHIIHHTHRSPFNQVSSNNSSFASLRLAQFSSCLPSRVNTPFPPLLFNILATLGCLYVQRPWPTLRAFNPDVFIRCAFCNLIVPLADLFGRNPRSEIEYTAELLNYLSFLHTSNCNGYSCIRHLYDPPLSVAAESLSVVSNDYESQNGTRNTLLFYF